MDVELVNSSVHKVLDDAIATAYDRVVLKRINILNTYTEEDLLIPLDPVSLQMAFLNLITNAIEAMEEDKGILKISTRSTGESIQVIFTDNGSGISEENMEKNLRTLFYRQEQWHGYRPGHNPQCYPCTSWTYRCPVQGRRRNNFYHKLHSSQRISRTEFS